MKKVISILMIIFSAFFLLMFSIMTLALLPEFSLGTFIFLIVIFLIPGGLLLFGGIKLLGSSKKAAQRSAQNLSWQTNQSGSGTSFNPFDAASVNDFVQEQLKHGDAKTVKTSNGSTQTVFTTSSSSTTSTSSSSSDIDGQQFNEVFNTFFGGQGGFTAAAAATPKDPVSVDCPGCGSKTTVYPTQSVNCEFCGTVVNYTEK